ncbi:hypothetical protein LS482_12125 [Sinomicrobium kalidii]|uniref:hypothetical protein n=1 Tax=Sinomicrobium kalidii TaxID=2900738 RepID=UPI001E4F3B96|nr:hypothetical protein [Sinomicrobium kalidii]UGU14448.1 hypothetical protein LS482_12125 [Sinomicrobium kalidii]
METLHETVVKSKELSSDWWDKFLEDTKNMTQPFHYNNVFDDHIELRHGVLEIFRKLRKGEYPFRVYIENKRRDDYNEILFENKPEEKEDIESWSKRIFAFQKFGIILNHGESYDRGLSLSILKYLKPLLDKVGYPVHGIDFTIFIGNYGWTPLGIHTDNTGENVMHFHLGPGEKTMYIWDTEEFKEQGGRSNDQRIDKFLPHAKHKMTFGPGGIFFMPWNFHHIGQSEELSVGLSVWLNRPRRDDLISKVFEEIHKEYTIKEAIRGKEDTNIPIIDLKRNLLKNDVLETVLINVNNDIKEMTVSKLIETSVRDYQYSLKSNLGYAISLKEQINNKSELTLDSYIKLDYPFDILYYTPDKERIKIFIKGKKIEMVYHSDIKTLINRINTAQKYKTSDLLSGLFVEWPEGAGLRILELIYEKEGILNSID